MLKKFLIIFLCLSFFIFNAKAQNSWHRAVASNNVETKHNPQVCDYVLSLANSGKLQNALLKSDVISWGNYDGERLINLNLAQQNSLTFFKRFDLNDDGKAEVVVLNAVGNADLFYLFDENFVAPMPILRFPQDNWESENLSQSQGISFLQYGERFYKVGLSKMGQIVSALNYVSVIDVNNVERVLCQFQPVQYHQELVKSANNTICEMAKNDQVKYYDFDIEHNITYKNIVEYGEITSQELELQGSSPRKYAAQLDIDNDGTKDDIFLLDVGYSDNRACKYSLPLKFDGKNGAIRGNITNLLLGQITNLCGGIESAIFEYEGENYLQIKFTKDRPFNYHKVLKIKDNKIEKICDFEVKMVYRLI